jgi:hypothetical protein
MSSPKADEISPTQQLLMFESDRARFSGIEVECAQIRRRADTLREQWEKLCMHGAYPFEETTEKLDLLKKSLALNNSSLAVAEAESIRHRASTVIASIEHSVAGRMKELEDRFGRAAFQCRQATANYQALRRLPETFEGKGLDKEQVQERIRQFVSVHTMPGLPTFRFDPESIRHLETFEYEIAKLSEAIELENQALLSMHDNLVIEKMVGDGRQRAERQQVFEEALRRSSSVHATPLAENFDLHLDDKIHILIARADTLPAGPGKDVLKDKLRAALEERTESNKRNLWHSAEIAYSACIGRNKELAEWSAKLDAIERRIACESASAEVHLITQSINELRRTMSGSSLADLESRATAAVATAAKRRNSHQKVQAMLDTLRELGYQTEPGDEATIEGGRWIAQKDNEEDYAIALLADDQIKTLQMQVVRTVIGGTKSSPDRLQKDFERETVFCTEHAQFRSQMSAKGYEFRPIFHHPAGQIPVFQLTDDASKSGKTRKTERTLKMQQRESS